MREDACNAPLEMPLFIFGARGEIPVKCAYMFSLTVVACTLISVLLDETL